MSDGPGLGLNEWLSRQIHASDCLVPGCLSDGNAATRAIAAVVAEAFLGLPLQERARLVGIELRAETKDVPVEGYMFRTEQLTRYVTAWEPK